MNNLTQKIVSYIEYLTSIDFQVSMHFLPDCVKKLPYQVWQKLLKYNSHNNPYCIKVKACGNSEKCIAHQRSIINFESFVYGCKTCYAGVKEFVYTITVRDKIIGYVVASGYKGDSGEILDKPLYDNSLKSEPLCEALLNTLLAPLCIMLENLFEKCEKAEDSEYNLMLQYLAENHTTVTLSSFCKYFSRSKSYVSHMFKNAFGVSFSAYCNDLKLNDAKNLLLITDTSITDIAMNSGFNDVSYFVRLFKEKYGQSPLQYRKKNQG
ncbi:MAG: helix-turn-helix transcriptional regulator [Clostridiales bacterium]|nr:helix-turn-helix transcriptional regulator [Clostridiales bacterium]